MEGACCVQGPQGGSKAVAPIGFLQLKRSKVLLQLGSTCVLRPLLMLMCLRCLHVCVARCCSAPSLSTEGVHVALAGMLLWRERYVRAKHATWPRKWTHATHHCIFIYKLTAGVAPPRAFFNGTTVGVGTTGDSGDNSAGSFIMPSRRSCRILFVLA